MIVENIAMVKWNGFIKKWYEEKGYIWTKINDLFECKVEDLQINSTVKVKTKCDYCGSYYYPEYRRILKARSVINKDCCCSRLCMVNKSREVSLKIYGVDSYKKLNSSKQYLRKLFQIPFEEVNNYCLNKGLILLTNKKEYENEKSVLHIICSNHKEKGMQETNFANIKRIKSCCNYGGVDLTATSRRLNGNDVYQEFINRGLIPLFKFEDYKNNSTPLPFLCPDHLIKGIQYKNYANLFHTSHKCYYCGRESANEKLRTDKDEVFEYFNSKNLIVENIDIYENKDVPIEFRCKTHINDIQIISYRGLKLTKQPCVFCREENNISILNKRMRSNLSKWKKDSKKLYNNKCIFTNSQNIEVHHLVSFNSIIREALDLLGLNLSNKYSGEEYINIKNTIIKLHGNYPLGVCLDKKIT